MHQEPTEEQASYDNDFVSSVLSVDRQSGDFKQAGILKKHFSLYLTSRNVLQSPKFGICVRDSPEKRRKGTKNDIPFLIDISIFIHKINFPKMLNQTFVK